MDNDFDIEILTETVEDSESVQLPVNFLTLGELEKDDVKIYIRQDVYKALEKLAASDTSRELGSILLGEYTQDLGKTHVIITDYIEAKYTDASASTLTFTHETWEYVHDQHAKKAPDKKIIGWQHTHPTYGIFLSNYDMFIQENFFNLPFQIAYVIDPVQKLRGFFQWKNGHIEKLKGYYIYDEVGTPIKIDAPKEKKPASAPAKTGTASKVLITLLCLALVALGIFAFNLSSKYEQQQEAQKAILSQLEDQRSQILDQQSKLEQQDASILKLQELLAGNVLDSTGKTTAADLLKLLENNEITLPGQDDLIAQLKQLLAQTPENTTVTFRSYTVAAGDNLSGICKANGLDYRKNAGIILAINGISDANHIYVGQTLLLPAVQ